MSSFRATASCGGAARWLELRASAPVRSVARRIAVGGGALEIADPPEELVAIGPRGGRRVGELAVAGSVRLVAGADLARLLALGGAIPEVGGLAQVGAWGWAAAA